ncbi:MAG: bifunctional UDP-sugar hydrolase/5'-nucleotidase, partial [Syntrophales bacterium]|nr:bifunctional UDP-sugar hydrolase/5'-nucleotidase [Syntrophales bacterium]
DLHSYFLPQRLPGAAGPSATVGGYAKLATLIREQRNLHRDKTILVDAGDFSMGTLFHTSYMTDAFELRLMGKLGYDATTLGNHDFDFHLDGLAGTLNAAKRQGTPLPALVASNVVFGPPSALDQSLRQAFKDYPVREYTILERNGLRIGLFGILGRDAQSDAPFAKPVTFADPVAESKRIAAILKDKEKADVVICLSHSGTSADKAHSEDEILAREVPGIDVIISGHTHTILPRPIIVGKTIIVSAGSYSAYLGVLEVAYNRDRGTKLVSYALPKVSEKIPDVPALANEISSFKTIVDREYLAAYRVKFDQVVAESGFDMESLDYSYKHPGETGIGDMITDAYRYAVEKAEGPRYDHVHVVVQPLGHIRSTILKGKISVADLFRVLSLGLGTDGTPGYPLLTAYLSGRELKKLLEVETTVAPIKADAHLQLSGVKCTINPNRIPFDRVTSVSVMEKDGSYSPLDPARLYRVGMNFYAAVMVDYVSHVSHGLLTITPKDREGRPLNNIRDAVIPAGSFNPGMREIKEWAALAAYMKSFPDTNGNGIPDIPARYGTTEGRLIYEPSWNPVKLIAGGTYITYGAISVSALAFLIAVLLIRAMVRVRLVRRRTD